MWNEALPNDIYVQLESSKLKLVAKKRRFATTEPQTQNRIIWPRNDQEKFAHTSVPVDIPLNFLTILDWGLQIKRRIYTDNLK